MQSKRRIDEMAITRKRSGRIVERVLAVVVILLVLLSLCVDGLFVYYKFFNKDITIGVNYLGDQTAIDVKALSAEQQKDYEKRCILEANYFSNDRGNGVELQELQLNYFMDWTLTSDKYRSTGMQYAGNLSEVNSAILKSDTFLQSQPDSDYDDFIQTDFYYYDRTLDISWSGGKGINSVATSLDRASNFVVSIGGEPYAIQLDKKSTKKVTSLFGVTVLSITSFANWGQLFKSVVNAIKSNSAGYGDYYITLDLSNFFTIRKYDTESGKFLADDVTNVIKNYAMLKFHYDSNGAKTAKQSMFGSIECNNSYGLTDEEKNTEYWQERVIFNLTENDLQTRYSEVLNGNLLSLNAGIKNKLATYKRAKLVIEINVTSENKIIGLDFDAFKGVQVEAITINGNGAFKIYSGALIDTNIKTITHSSTITLSIDDNATNSDYLEVIKQ